MFITPYAEGACAVPKDLLSDTFIMYVGRGWCTVTSAFIMYGGSGRLVLKHLYLPAALQGRFQGGRHSSKIKQ
jgi:hypothetical protein